MNKKLNGIEILILEGETTTGDNQYFFSSEQEYIVLGCDPDSCHVVFSETTRELGIGNEHLGLRRSLGRYQLDLNNDHFVSIDGEAPYEDQEISGSVELILGQNIRVQIKVIDHRKQVPATNQTHHHPGEIAKANRKAVYGLVVIVAIGLLLGSFLFRDIEETDENLDRVFGEIDELSVRDNRISSNVIDQVRQSVYLVLVQNKVGGERVHGTAWVTENNQLATNAHVARIFETIKSDEKILVRSSISPYQSHEVTKVKLHPGYEAFKKVWDEYVPVQKGLRALDVMRTISPADVALMEVTDSQKLAPPLKLASHEELAKLRAGIPVAFVGYPAENLLPGSLKQPIPVAQQDELVRVTDFFMSDRKDGKNRLIQHGLPLIGGASGSPLFTKDGTVIGLISAVNVASTLRGRIANPADINFAQRIDFLQDLNQQNEELSLSVYRSQWEQSLTEFSRGIDSSLNAVNRSALDVFSPPMQAHEISISGEVKNVLPELKRVGAVQSVELPHAGLHLVTVASNNYRFNFKLKRGKKILPTYDYQIPYSNLISYHFFITDQAENLNLEISTRYKSNRKESIKYTLNIKSWPLNTHVVSEQIAIHNVKTKISTDKQPQLLQEYKGIAITIPTKKGRGFIYRQSINFAQPGDYLFLTLYKEIGRIQNALFDGDNIIKKGESNKRFGVLLYHHEDDKKQFEYTLYNKTAISNIDLRVYFWPEKKDKK